MDQEGQPSKISLEARRSHHHRSRKKKLKNFDRGSEFERPDCCEGADAVLLCAEGSAFSRFHAGCRFVEVAPA